MSKLAIPTKIGALVFAVAIVLVWQYAVERRIVSPIFLPAPSNIAIALVDLISSGELWTALRATLARMVGGWMVAATAGVALGAIVGLSARLAGYLNPTLEFFRQLPAAVVIPP